MTVNFDFKWENIYFGSGSCVNWWMSNDSDISFEELEPNFDLTQAECIDL